VPGRSTGRSRRSGRRARSTCRSRSTRRSARFTRRISARSPSSQDARHLPLERLLLVPSAAGSAATSSRRASTRRCQPDLRLVEDRCRTTSRPRPRSTTGASWRSGSGRKRGNRRDRPSSSRAFPQRRDSVSGRRAGGEGRERRNGFVFISHVGDVTPSGFLPVAAGNVRERSIVDIYRNDPLFQDLRDYSKLKGSAAGATSATSAAGRGRARGGHGRRAGQRALLRLRPPRPKTLTLPAAEIEKAEAFVR